MYLHFVLKSLCPTQELNTPLFGITSCYLYIKDVEFKTTEKFCNGYFCVAGFAVAFSCMVMRLPDVSGRM